MNVLYTNIDCLGLPNKIQQLSQYIYLQDKPPDVIALTEIKYKNKWHLDTSELTIHGYHLFSNNLQENARGIIVYVKDNLMCKQIFFGNPFSEYVLLDLKLQGLSLIHISEPTRPY